MKIIEGAGNGRELPAELGGLGSEVVDLLYAQTYARGELDDEPAVCRAFAELLLRHCELCSVNTYLRDEAGRLSGQHVYAREGLDAAAAARAADWLAAEMERAGRELQVWPGETAADGEAKHGQNLPLNAAHGLDLARAESHGQDLERAAKQDEDLWRAARPLFEAAGVAAGVAVPLRVRGAAVGAQVVLSAHPERLRAALQGVRFIAAPLAIGLGNARRIGRLDEQRGEIEHLYEELRARSSALEEANRELRRVSRYRSLFLSRMSHELRTPLTSLLGFTEIMLEHGRLTKQQRGFCEKIQQSGNKLRTKVNQLVDLSRLEAGRAELFLHEFSLRETLRESCEAVARLAEKQSVTLDCDTDPALGTIVSDEGKLRQVFYNLLAHAIGRTPAGGTVSVRAAPAARGRVAVEIADGGEPVADAAHLFEPVDVDPPSELSTNMNELGLVIAHRLVDALSGTVVPAARADGGFTLRVEIPTCPPAPE